MLCKANSCAGPTLSIGIFFGQEWRYCEDENNYKWQTYHGWMQNSKWGDVAHQIKIILTKMNCKVNRMRVRLSKVDSCFAEPPTWCARGIIGMFIPKWARDMHRANIACFVEWLNFYIVVQFVKWAYCSETSIYIKINDDYACWLLKAVRSSRK